MVWSRLVGSISRTRRGNRAQVVDLLNCSGRFRTTTPVGLFGEFGSPPSCDGHVSIVNLAGNCWEWVCGYFHPDDQSDYSLLGGSWDHHSRMCAEAFTFRDEPENRRIDAGFRLAVCAKEDSRGSWRTVPAQHA